MQITTVFVGGIVALLALPVHAQSSDVINRTGVVDSVDANSITLTVERSSQPETFKLAPDVLVVQIKPASLADIKPNDFVASAARAGADGRLHSAEVRIFPDAMRGVGEGQRPMNDEGRQTMTNATVTGTAIVNGSNNLTVRFAGGESELVVDPGVPVVRMDVADRSLVKGGVRVRVQGVRTADGASISRITLQ